MNAQRSTKQLKSYTYVFADGSETVHRHAVFLNGKRIGTVHHCICGKSEWFDPFRGAGGYRGDGHVVTKNFQIRRQKSLAAAIALV